MIFSFIKEEPDKLDGALKRCKKLTGTLVTLKRLASVQEQRNSNAQNELQSNQLKNNKNLFLDQLLTELTSSQQQNPMTSNDTSNVMSMSTPIPPPRSSSSSISRCNSTPPFESHKEILELRHQELLKKQRQLQVSKLLSFN